ncbi:MAG: radical SAM protein, partial [Candidatus Hodarchaeota archaeon]
MVVDQEVVDVIHLADGSKTFGNIINSLELNKGFSYEKKEEEITTLFKILDNADLIYSGKSKIKPAPVSPILENITINVTRRCNLRCSHCFLESVLQIQDSLRIEDLERFLMQGEDYLSRNLNFAILGGEPLLAKKKTIEIAKLGQERGSEVVVSTNGLLVD